MSDGMGDDLTKPWDTWNRINIKLAMGIHLPLTHNKEQFQNNKKVSPCLTFYDSGSISPVIQKVVHSQQEEENIGGLEDNQDAVEVDELWAGEEHSPLHAIGVIGIGSLPLVTPRRSQEALSNPHAGQSEVTGSKTIHQSNGNADEERKALKMHNNRDELNELNYNLCIQSVQNEFDFLIIKTGWLHGCELEEDVGSHGIDPEHEGGEGIEGDVPNGDAAKWTIWKQSIDTPAEVVARQTNVCNKVIEDKSDGNLSKQRTVKVWINYVGNKG